MKIQYKVPRIKQNSQTRKLSFIYQWNRGPVAKKNEIGGAGFIAVQKGLPCKIILPLLYV